MARALVLGVGNPLMSDDGVGLHLLAALSQLPAIEGVEYLDAGTLGLLLLPEIEDCTALLVLDAARFRSPPGTVRCVEGAAMDEFLVGSSSGVHEVGLRDLLDAARLTDALPALRALVAIEPRDVDWGETLSPPVEAAVAEAAAAARALLERWAAARD